MRYCRRSSLEVGQFNFLHVTSFCLSLAFHCWQFTPNLDNERFFFCVPVNSCWITCFEEPLQCRIRSHSILTNCDWLQCANMEWEDLGSLVTCICGNLSTTKMSPIKTYVLALSPSPTQKLGKGFPVCAESAYYVHALCDHVVPSYCWQWHYRIDEQILLRSDYMQILWGKSSRLASINTL